MILTILTARSNSNPSREPHEKFYWVTRRRKFLSDVLLTPRRMERVKSVPKNEDGAGDDTIEALGNEKLVDILAHSKPNWLGSGYLRMYLFCALIFLTSTMNGLDGSLMGSINTLPSYVKYYHLPPSGNAGTGLVFAIFNGSITATSAVYASHKYLGNQANADWRTPLWVQMLCPGIVCLGIWFCPESPRWLIGNERDEEARAILVKYHANGDSNHPLVKLEMAEMIESLRREGMLSWRNFFDLRVLFKSRSRRYRMMLNVSFSWFGQFSGNNIASYYLPYLLENVGVADTNTKLLLNIVYAITGWIPAMAGARCHDIIGRRKMLLGCTAGMAVCLAIAAGTAAGYINTGSRSSSSASIAFIYLFGSVFAFAFTSMQPVYPGEVMSNDMRGKGMGVSQLTSGLAGFVNTFAAPVALKNIRYWFYVFFVFWDLFEFAFIYFFYVETKGRTLEELDEVFEAPNPRKASTAPTALPRQLPVGQIDEEEPKHEAVV
ncbi:lactose permease [Histoplasma capsulatum var. duboisii H88]|uniref:Lactose permease n=1 Tax=Ajellomyces capsulatus (strain H88) TaxID=544711 RepID=F0UQG6_AJEC8|nr:lactose permease [Histoplasma capsulatum var. duboisii H88]